MTLTDFIQASQRLFILSGAGCSTPSGIPDYRDQAGQWKRAAPMTFQTFIGSEAARRRYWARSLVGWPVMARARPNGAHRALHALETSGRLSLLVTQNVDGLHQQAGSAKVIDLHGRLDRVTCLDCGERGDRHVFQTRLERANPAWTGRQADLAPDGDADLDETDFSSFVVPACAYCHGVIKPDVVFFGEAVPRDRVEQATDALERSDAMLVVGSSLMVFSGFRFARQAAERGFPLASVTLGIGRADNLLMLKASEPCDQALAFLLDGIAA